MSTCYVRSQERGTSLCPQCEATTTPLAGKAKEPITLSSIHTIRHPTTADGAPARLHEESVSLISQSPSVPYEISSLTFPL